MIDLEPRDRVRLVSLFENFPVMPTVVSAILRYGMGRALVDDVERPRVGLAKLDFTFVAGDTTTEAAQWIAQHAAHDVVSLDPNWHGHLRATHGDKLTAHGRTSFRSARFDRDFLARAIEELPRDFIVVRVDAGNVEDFATLGPSLVGNFNSREEYLARGLGFGIQHGGEFVSAVSSFCVAGNELEIEIQTRPMFRRRGLATIAAARLILHCLDHGITPHWDAHNEPSAQLARKLGFCDEVKYETLSRAID